MIRVIPRLDIKGPNLVKGIHLEGLRVLGKPERFARLYYEQGADELLYMDIVASLYERNNLLHIVEKSAKEIFIPLTVGGGLRSITDITKVLRAGADKVAINTAAIKNPHFIREAARRFGSSTIIISIETMKKQNGKYEAYTDNGRQSTGVDALKWAQQAARLGAGEILLTSINQEGTGQGFDCELIRHVATTVQVPVIACGGGGTINHVSNVITYGRADAVCVASLLHYYVVQHYSFDDQFPEEGNVEFLKTKRGFSRIRDVSLNKLKQHLHHRKIICRL